MVLVTMQGRRYTPALAKGVREWLASPTTSEMNVVPNSQLEPCENFDVGWDMEAPEYLHDIHDGQGR